MRCAWQELMNILPPWLRSQMEHYKGQTLQELRLRRGQPPELIIGGNQRWLTRCVTEADISFCVNTASRYSPWSASTSSRGYVTAPGGHRIGLCGEAVLHSGKMTGFRQLSSICIRVARDIPGIAARAAANDGSILILGAPGWGKTTLMRDLIRQISDGGTHVAVVDERGELFPPEAGFPMGRCTDVITHCAKGEGMEAVLRSMGPQCIAVDEITATQDCEALLSAHGCGVRLLATAHAGSLEDFRSRALYRPLWQSGLFDTYLVMRQDKSWRAERMDI